ncbi:DUF349 domain-containing protein [Marinobacter confluentis]|uniref:DUF349 domain-containing protein n=1 Tax=Marinobacter confluentis TaxID=1697557 RepID=A0A4Z1CE20_9GAMM|nr:DUF349 domain-containing protein [Marinobacter confluentis]TGN37980.1 DUF349 domain-containing protein [Marinobacter confluentis]
MAAFIQKLFGRKQAPAPKAAEPSGPTANQQEKSDRQDNLRQQQLTQLSGSPSQAELENLATQGATAEIRLSAAKLLTAKDSLQRVQKRAKGKDKGVYQCVRQALQTIRAAEDEQQQREQAISTLIQNARDQARSDDTKLFEPRLEALLKRWAELETHASQDQASEFLQAVHECRARLEVMNTEKAREAQAREQKNQRAETLALLEETLENLKQPAPDSEPSVASLDALQKTQENRWLEATRDTPVEKQEQKTYESLMLPLRNYIGALRRFGQSREAIQALLDPQTDNSADGLAQTAKDLLADVDWPADFPVPTLLQKLAKDAGEKSRPESGTRPAAADSEAQKTLAETVTQTLARLEQALEARQLKESRQLFKTAQQQFKQLDRKHSQPLQARMQLLGGQLRELGDWQGFATRPKQIALCEQMEYLAEQPMEPEAKAERIKELQNEWRELGGSSDRELWARFKQASDLAYEPCKAYFSAKSGLKQANLETRKTIISQLKTFIENADWQAIDWKAAERIHQKAREEWKAAWPVEFRDNRSVQKDFDALLKQLEEPLNQERKNNEAIKQTIVENAEALIKHEPLSDAMNQAKALQNEWQQVGITRHREDRKLWQAFRNACDQIFARRDAEKNEQQEQTRAADESAAPILDKARQMVDNQATEDLTACLTELEGLASEPLSNGVQNKVKQEQARLTSLIEQIRSRQKLDQWRQHIRARVDGPSAESDLPQHWQTLASDLADGTAAELVIRAEILAETASPVEEQTRRMEIQVQRLAEGMGGNGNEQGRLPQMESLVAGWCLRPEDETVNQSRADRLIAALQAVLAEQA